nr:alanine racemase [Nocardioides perillae]
MGANLERAAQRARAAGVVLRPHAKTHKSARIADLQRAAGAVGLTVATVAEAEVFADHGHDDLFVAYPLWLDAARGARVAALAERVGLTFGVDSAEGAAQAARVLGSARSRVRVRVEVDAGHHRTGAAPADAGAVARAADAAGLVVEGLFTFPGHAYAAGAGGAARDDEARALAVAAAATRAVGLEPAVLSGGSTPTLGSELDRPGELTELRPGVYALGDAQQWELGHQPPHDVALWCVATVVSHAGGRAVLDAGSKVLGADRAAYSSGWGRLLDHHEARVVALSEHHATVDLAGHGLPPLGSRVRVVPNHACVAVNLADVLHVDDEGREEPWAVDARGANA